MKRTSCVGGATSVPSFSHLGSKQRCLEQEIYGEKMSKRGSSLVGRKSSTNKIYTDRLQSSFAASEREKWLKLSSTPVFTTSSPPLLSPSTDSKVSDKASLHCTNKASMLRMQCSLQNTTQKTDINKVVIQKNKHFALKCKVLTASTILKDEAEMSHGFLLGSRYNSAHCVDTAPLKKCGVYVPRNRKSNSFTNARDQTNNGKSPSAASSAQTPTHPTFGGTRTSHPKKKPVSIKGVSYSEDTLEDSASFPSPKKPPPNSHVNSDSESQKSNSVTASSSSNTSSSETSQGTFVEENESDLLSPEAQKLASQILLLSESGTSPNSLSQEVLEEEALLRCSGDGICPSNTFLTLTAATGAVQSDSLPESNVTVGEAQNHLLSLHANAIEEPVILTSTSSNIVVDLSHLTAGSEEDST